MLSTLEKILFLKQIELFREFNARELGIIAQKAVEKSFSRGDVIFRQGEQGDSLYLVVGGKVRVVREDGQKKETLAILEERTCFGEMAILSEEVRSATIEALETLTLLKIDREEFRQLILKKPEMAFPIFRILIERLRNTNNLYMKALEGRK
ncbi:MAG: cyclic nucleotide-binding domain-containing protein [Firmicutes bacterium]|nr:cyclic nucleotide-binding domain-containing protein [Bacillota bacterium]